MRTVYFDGETIRTSDPDVIAALTMDVRHPASMSKPETIAKWEVEQRPAAVAEAIAKTALDAAYGRLCCLAFAVDDAPTMSILAQGHKDDAFDEKWLLESFFTVVTEETEGEPFRVCGHNVLNFDLKFIAQRAFILDVAIPAFWPVAPKPWDERVVDTMTVWTGSTRDYVKLDKIARALGVGGKGDIDGSMVGALWDAGEFEKVGAYCGDDVDLVRAVHKRMARCLVGRAA